MEMMYYQQLGMASYQDSLELLEADIQHANALAAVIPRGKGGARLEMKLVYYTDGRSRISRHGRKSTISEFYAVIFPSLQRLHFDLRELNYSDDENPNFKNINKKRIKGNESFANFNMEREDECGICLEPCTKMVLPNCCHAMCINCYRDWNARSESCPFCRGNMKRVKSRDLWVLTCGDDVIDQETALRNDLLHFYLYINGLPKDSPDALFMMYNEYLI